MMIIYVEKKQGEIRKESFPKELQKKEEISQNQEEKIKDGIPNELLQNFLKESIITNDKDIPENNKEFN